MNTRGAPYRVVITGSECTGKSALVRALSAERLAPYSDEAARLFVTQNGREIVEPDLAVIAAHQRALEDAVIEMGTVLVLHDTDLFSTVIYARHYFGNKATGCWLAPGTDGPTSICFAIPIYRGRTNPCNAAKAVRKTGRHSQPHSGFCSKRKAAALKSFAA